MYKVLYLHLIVQSVAKLNELKRLAQQAAAHFVELLVGTQGELLLNQMLLSETKRGRGSVQFWQCLLRLCLNGKTRSDLPAIKALESLCFWGADSPFLLREGKHLCPLHATDLLASELDLECGCHFYSKPPVLALRVTGWRYRK